MRRVGLVAVFVGLCLGGAMAQSGYLFTIPSSASDTDLIRVEGLTNRLVTVGAVRAMGCSPLCPEPPPPPVVDDDTCTANAFIAGYDPPAYASSIAHTNAGIAAASQIVRRDGAGVPSSSGHIVFLTMGPSTGQIMNPYIKGQYDADPLGQSFVTIIDVSQSGAIMHDWADVTNPVWAKTHQKILAKGRSAAQVGGAYIMLVQAWPDTYGAMTEQRVRDFAAAFVYHFPNAKIIWPSSHPSTHYTNHASLGNLQYKVPFHNTHMEAHLLASLVETPDWPIHLRYLNIYTNGATVDPTAGFGLTCADVRTDDRHHLTSPAGKQKVGGSVFQQIKADPASRGWLFQVP